MLLFFFSCSDKNKFEAYNLEILSLKQENDSLVKILEEIKTKYVFDSITIRHFPNPKNTHRLNSKVKGELLVVGFNNDRKKTRIVKIDSMDHNPQKLYNPDTLDLKNGGYKYEIDLNKNKVIWRASINIENEYGANKKATIAQSIRVKKN